MEESLCQCVGIVISLSLIDARDFGLPLDQCSDSMLRSISVGYVKQTSPQTILGEKNGFLLENEESCELIRGDNPSFTL